MMQNFFLKEELFGAFRNSPKRAVVGLECNLYNKHTKKIGWKEAEAIKQLFLTYLIIKDPFIGNKMKMVFSFKCNLAVSKSYPFYWPWHDNVQTNNGIEKLKMSHLQFSYNDGQWHLSIKREYMMEYENKILTNYGSRK